jgi:hypothetical protein
MNALKSPNVAANIAANIAVNSQKAANTAANTFMNTASSFKNMAKDTATSITNSIKNVENAVSGPIKDSLSALPEEAPALGLSLPLIIGIGALIIVLILFVVFRDRISRGLEKTYNYLKGLTSSASKSVSNEYKSLTATPPTNAAAAATAATVTAPPIATNSIVNSVIPGRKKVFNVSSNKYKYSDAEPLCKALGAELATYDQVKKAWDAGADWCNYGWVKGQSAVYPTQQSTFDSLQTADGDDERLACGTVGVNGGFIDNPDMRFGVNCYGDKPPQSDHDLKVTNERGDIPMTTEMLGQKKKELKFKAHANEIGILPFNNSSW